MYAHTVCTRPFLLLLKGPGYEAIHPSHIVDQVLSIAMSGLLDLEIWRFLC